MASRRIRERGEPSVAPPAVAMGTEAMFTFTNPTQQKRSDRLRSKQFGEFRLIDWNVLASIAQADAVRALISAPEWTQLFSISESAYFELTVEFYSSFDFRWAGADNVIDFRFGGVPHTLTLREFNVTMGFCTEDFTRSPAYSALLLDFPPDVNLQTFWASISNDPEPYTPKKSKGSHLISPSFRYVHYLLTYTLSARGDSHGVVTRSDLLYLYSISQHVPLNLGSALAVFFRHQAENRRLSAIHGGPFITFLAKRMGIWDTLPPLTLIHESSPITFLNLRAIGLARRRGNDFEGIPPAVDDLQFNFDPAADLGDLPPSPPIPPPPQQVPFAAPGFYDYFDQHFGQLNTRIDQLQQDQLAMRTHFDDRFSTLEQRHTASMEHLSREFADLRNYYQRNGDSDED